MLGKVKDAVQKKVKQVPQPSTMLNPNEVSPTNNNNNPKKKKRRKRTKKAASSLAPVAPVATSPKVKSRRVVKKKPEKKTEKEKEESVDESGSEEDDEPVKEEVLMPISQVVPQKPHPRDCAQRILRSEKPELLGNMDLSSEEVLLLDNYLLRKGALRPGFTVTLGRLVDTESKIQVGSGDIVDVVSLIAYGRFAAVYLANKEVTSEQERKGLGNIFALKISRRMYSTTRILHEIAMLEHLYKMSRRNNCLPTHITPVFFHGTAGGTPYMVMPMLDFNLAKIREDLGGKIRWCDAFYIGQEALTGIKECHTQQIIHRDVKPTNLLLGIQNPKSWWLCDFGDACSLGKKRILSPPDALTLPFLSREGHRAVSELVPSTVRMDLESWFYMLLDLFIQLPWTHLIEETETLTSKVQFWTSMIPFFQTNATCLPPQLSQIAQILAGSCDEQVYNRLTQILKDGFIKYLDTQPWRPSWMDNKRKLKTEMVILQKATPRRPPRSRSASKRNVKKG